MWLRALIGPVWRLAWQGDLEGGERTKALGLLSHHLQSLYASGGAQRELALLGSAWVTLALDEDPLGTSWQIDELLSAPVGSSLRGLLDLRSEGPALKAYWRPLRFAAAQARLAELAGVQPKFRANPAPELYGEAREDAQALLRAAVQGDAAPELRLLDADIEDWASEPRGTHQLLRGVKVWNTLVEWMRRVQDAGRDMVDAWAPGQKAGRSPVGVQDWPARFDADVELAACFLFDLILDANRTRPPSLLTARGALGALEVCAAELDDHGRAEILYLVDEVLASGLGAEPAWAVASKEQLRRLSAEVDALVDRAQRRARVTSDPQTTARLAEVTEQLGEASTQLQQRQTREATEWVALARATLDDAVADANLAEVEARAAALWSRLRAADRLPEGLGEPPAAVDESADLLRAAVDSLERAWAIAVREVESRSEHLLDEARWAPLRSVLEEAVQLARDAVAAGDLKRALRSLAQARRGLDGASVAFDERLDAGLKQLRHRARRSSAGAEERHGLDRQLARCRDRADVGLPTEQLRRALTTLVGHLEQAGDGPEMLAIGVPEGLRPLCWWQAAVPIASARHGVIPAKVVVGKLFLVRAAAAGWVWEKLPSRRERFLPVVSTERTADDPVPPHLADWSGRLFLEDPGGVRGPYRVQDGALVPADERGLVGRIERRDFEDLFGTIELDAFDAPERHVIDPPSLREMVTEGAQLLDRMGAEGSEHWLQGMEDGLDGVSVDALQRAMNHIASMDLPEDLLAQRLDRLRPVLGAAQALARAREGAVAAWLESERGQVAIADAARVWVAEHRELVDEAVLAEKARMERELGELEAERTASTVRLERLRAEVEAATQVRDDARFALLASWGGGETRRSRPVRRSLSPESTMRTATSLDAEIDRIVGAVGGGREQVANELVTLLTQRFVVAAAAPGGLPAQRLTAMLAYLGHPTHTPRHLAVDVRHDWRDDMAVFGRWSVAEQQWQPGAEGVVEHLLHAARCWGAGQHGLHVVQFDGLARQDPERYLGRVLRALREDAPLRLHRSQDAAVWPASVPNAANIRWLATTTGEHDGRLGQGFLAQTAFLVVDEDVEALARGAISAPPTHEPVSWRSLLALRSQDPVEHPALGEVVRWAHRERLPGAPGALALRGARAYLQTASSVMAPEDAQDFAVLQHLLPSLRGMGRADGELLKRLAERLQTLKLRRSAARMEQVVADGSRRGDFFDGASV